MCSCDTSACVQGDRRGLLGSGLPLSPSHGCWGQQEAGADVGRVCAESAPVVLIRRGVVCRYGF